MRMPIRSVFGAITMTCFAVPFSSSVAQSGISTNPAPVEARDYFSAVHALSKYEVDASRLALTRSQTPAARAFAQEMVAHHTRAMAEHARLLDVPSTSEPGSALAGPLSEMLNSLENTPSVEFNAAYKRGQIAAHEEALKVHTSYAERGSDTAARAKAQAAIPKIRKHLATARNLPEA